MATIKDIAKKSGYSITTVSRALNGFDDVNEETKKKIQQVADELKYYPNAIARSLVKKGSHTFGYILYGLQRGVKHIIIQEFMAGIYDFTREKGYEVLVMTVDANGYSNKSYLQFAREHNLAGIIVSGISTDDMYYKEMLNSKIPCVLIDQIADNIRVGCVSSDNYKASREAISYLYNKGHRHIAYLNGKENAAVSISRYSGYQAEMRERGLSLSLDYVLNGEFSEEIAYEKVKGFLPLHPEVTAIFCASDLMAIGAMRAAMDLGLEVPARLSVIGFDNIPVAGYTTPSLTTIEQDFYQMGYEAAQMLYSIIKGKDIPHSKKIPHKFIERSSVAMV